MSQANSFPAIDPSAPSERLDLQSGGAGARPSPASGSVPPLGSRRAPWIAAILAGCPGLGAIYNGSYARGIAFFLAVAVAMKLADRGGDLWGFAVVFLWLFNVIDAYREARLIRAGRADDREAARERPATSIAEGLGLGLLLLVVGVVATLDELGWDVAWLYDLWPLGLVIAGGWFVFVSIRRLRAQRRMGGDFIA